MGKLDWFGKIGIVVNEFGDGAVGVHVHRPKTRCKIYKMKPEDFDTVEIWDKLRKMVEAEKQEVLPGGECPNCHVPLITWTRRWQGRRFCGFCGERYDKN